MPLSHQFAYLLLLALPIACASWTVTHEEVFREPREFCKEKSQNCKPLPVRKFFYLFTCEYCFSHYVTALLPPPHPLHHALRRLARLPHQPGSPSSGSRTST